MGSGINISTAAMSWRWRSSPFSHTQIHAAATPHAYPLHCFKYKGSFALKLSNGGIYLLESKNNKQVRFCSAGSHSSMNESSDSVSSSGDRKAGNDGSHQPGSFTSNEILERLRRYGIAGVLSYGLLNTAYYLTTFLVVWFYVAPAPARMGYMAAVERFVKVMAMVWAGSQVTKLLRAGGALALAPLVDRALSWFTVKFNFESQGKAFIAIAGFCFLLAFLLFLVVTLLCA